MKNRLVLAATVLTAMALAGCATTSTTQSSSTTALAKPSATATPTPVKKARYQAFHKAAGATFKVEKGQTLWGIARSSEGYNKSCQWPLIYKANQGTVVDPDLIYPGMELAIPKDASDATGDKACEAAEKYGRHEPHTKPRTDVQLDF